MKTAENFAEIAEKYGVVKAIEEYKNTVASVRHVPADLSEDGFKNAAVRFVDLQFKDGSAAILVNYDGENAIAIAETLDERPALITFLLEQYPKLTGVLARYLIDSLGDSAVIVFSEDSFLAPENNTTH